MSEATPVVALSGEIHVARPRQATWVDMTEVESEDDIGQEEAPVFDPVESDDDVDSLVEELNVRVPSPRHSVVDALEIDPDQPLGEMQNSPLGELARWIPEPPRASRRLVLTSGGRPDVSQKAVFEPLVATSLIEQDDEVSIFDPVAGDGSDTVSIMGASETSGATSFVTRRTNQ